MATVNTAPRYAANKAGFLALLADIRDGKEDLELPTPNLYSLSPALAKYLIEEINSWS